MNRRGGGWCRDLPSKWFFLAVPNPFVGEHFCVSESFGYQKDSWIKGGGCREGVSHLFAKSFLSHSSEKYLRGSLCCVTKFRCRKSSCLNGFCLVFLSKIFCLAVNKTFVEEPFCVSESYGIEKICA